MKHVKALLIKFVMCLVTLYVVLGLFMNVEFSDIFTISLILTVTAYVIGDLFVLPRSGNTSATIADLGLAFIAVLLFGEMLIEGDNGLFLASIVSAIAIAVGEWFFHKYMNNQVLDEDEDSKKGFYHTNNEMSYKTEAAEETDIHDLYDSDPAATDEKEHSSSESKSDGAEK